MPTTAVRWSLRLPWSSAVRLQRLVELDAPGRIGDVVGRALGQLLDQPEPTIRAIVVHTAQGRAENPRDRTQICSWRVAPAVVARAQAWADDHPEIALSWLVDAAIRCYHTVCESRQGGEAVAGLAARRYRRLSPELIVLVDDEAHAA